MRRSRAILRSVYCEQTNQARYAMGVVSQRGVLLGMVWVIGVI